VRLDPGPAPVDALAVTADTSRFAPFVGRTSAPLTLTVEAGHIRRFADAVGDDDPIYRDAAAARAAGHPGIVAPPTFAVALRPNDPRAGMELDWRKLLHGEMELTYDRAVYAGDQLTLIARVADASVKQTRSGVMDVMVIETVASDGNGARVFVTRSTSLVRR
jgi:acyl dehydratase